MNTAPTISKTNKEENIIGKKIYVPLTVTPDSASKQHHKVIRHRKRCQIDRWYCFSFPNRTHCVGLRFGSYMSRNTVMKYVDSLVEKKLIKTEPTSVVTKDGIKRNGNLLYELRPFEEAVDYYNKKQLEQLGEQSRMEALAEKHPAIVTAF